MNVIRLMGGLGNQLFQYALGRALMNNGKTVCFDIKHFARHQHREYTLGNFNVNIAFSGFVNYNTCLDTGHSPTLDLSYLHKDACNFFGYFQHIEYFQHILPLLQKEIWVKEEKYTNEFLSLRSSIIATESVSVHIRRGDYLNNTHIPSLPFSYYCEAIKYTTGDLYIFSDDIPWCKEHFTEKYFDRKIIFVDQAYFLDFELMKLCKQHVICNSSFSYWAALLNDCSNKLVVTPDFWVMPIQKGKYNNYPESWIKLKGYGNR